MFHTKLTNFFMKYPVMCKVYTDVSGISGIRSLYHSCPSAREIIYKLKLVDYLHVQADKSWHNYNLYLLTGHILVNDELLTVVIFTVVVTVVLRGASVFQHLTPTVTVTPTDRHPTTGHVPLHSALEHDFFIMLMSVNK